jgi:diketogulonate reductase-like aldo/keto reductase
MTDSKHTEKPYGYVVEYGLGAKSFFYGERAEMYCELETEEAIAAGYDNIKTIPVYKRTTHDTEALLKEAVIHLAELERRERKQGVVPVALIRLKVKIQQHLNKG